MKSPSGSSQPREELHGLIEPDRTRSRQLLETAKHVDYILGAQAKHNMELADHQHFGEVGKERSRRTLIYSYDWIIDQGHEHAASVSQDAALLAANCGVPLMLSVNHRDLDPVFEPELIMFNGRDDECDDFTYPPTEDAGFGSNRGRCRTECRDYDTLVSAILLAAKHHAGSKAFIRSRGSPDGAGWTAAFELYSRTFPERELPWLDNWPKRARENG